jgi:hypothetical protein
MCYAYLVCDSLGAGAQESKSQRGTKHMQKTVSESSNDVSNDGKAKKVAPAVWARLGGVRAAVQCQRRCWQQAHAFQCEILCMKFWDACGMGGGACLGNRDHCHCMLCMFWALCQVVAWSVFAQRRGAVGVERCGSCMLFWLGNQDHPDPLLLLLQGSIG